LGKHCLCSSGYLVYMSTIHPFFLRIVSVPIIGWQARGLRSLPPNMACETPRHRRLQLFAGRSEKHANSARHLQEHVYRKEYWEPLHPCLRFTIAIIAGGTPLSEPPPPPPPPQRPLLSFTCPTIITLP